jgi:hypothetical protein
MNNSHPPPLSNLDVAAGVATLSLWLDAYSQYITIAVTTMAAIYYIIKFIRWFRTGRLD